MVKQKAILSGRARLTARQGGSANGSKDVQKKKEEPPPELTPLEKMLQGAGPVRTDGSDKYYGLENVSYLHASCAVTDGSLADPRHV